ncbi:MAG: tetratricopeptide repeat protein [Pyrinomonadaceae bacterium]
MNETTRTEKEGEESGVSKDGLSSLHTSGQLLIPTRGKRQTLASVRVSFGGYLSAAFVLTFAAFILIQAERDAAALALLCCAWLILPVFAFLERVKFDGQTLFRSGLVALLHKRLTKQALELKIDDIERIETNAVRTLRRGGRVRYRYRSEVSGNDLRFAFASGGKQYRLMARHLFSLVGDDKLDARTTELRDYVVDKKTLNEAHRALRVATDEVLENAVEDFTHTGKNSAQQRRRLTVHEHASPDDVERGHLLRRAGNELRIAGRLREAAEAFRRALLVDSRDASLIYEWARLLRSQASAKRDARLLARSRAGLWLAAKRSGNDAALLSRIGESFLEAGDIRRATHAFRRALQNEDAHIYRAELGLADIALRTGKLAHVVHHYGGASRVAKDRAAERFALREADYYARLNSDDHYLALELRRINWLQHLQRARSIAARLTFTGIGLAVIGANIDEAIRVTGWSLASSALLAWLCAIFAEKFFTHRRAAHHAE